LPWARAASTTTPRIKLYANKCIQISFSTISGEWVVSYAG
jgi:hypothetical protein